MIRLYHHQRTNDIGTTTAHGFALLDVKPLEAPRPIVLRRNPTNKGNELERKAEEAARRYETSEVQVGYTLSPAGMPARDAAREVRLDVYALQIYQILDVRGYIEVQ